MRDWLFNTRRNVLHAQEESCTQSEIQNARNQSQIHNQMHHESWPINYENSKKKGLWRVLCVASWAKGQRRAQRRNWRHRNENGLDNGKISFFIFFPSDSFLTDCFPDAGAVRTRRNVPEQYQILRWCTIKLNMACTGAVQKITLLSTYFPQVSPSAPLPLSHAALSRYAPPVPGETILFKVNLMIHLI